MSKECDVLVVGAGIVGLAVAHELRARAPELRIEVLEREDAVARHQTGSNSGVIHAGIYYKPGSLKARLCTEGMRRMYAFCEERGVRAERCGKVIVATDESELRGLDELERRGRANGVEGLARIGPEELREIEPHAAGVAALHSPNTGIVDFAEVARALAADLNVTIGCEVTGLSPGRVTHTLGVTKAKAVVVCAGGWSDRLAVRAGASAEPRIVPFRGAYLRLRPEARGLVRGLIYPVPDPELPFLGMHLTRTIDGEVLLGPTALMLPSAHALAWPGTWRMLRRFHATARRELRLAIGRGPVVAACARYVPELSASDVLSGPTGVRAQALARDGSLVDDFVIDELDGMLFVRNAPSPAATSSLAIAELLADRVQNVLKQP
jgi:(S)-2-hydroxyglutarate dehydrogenase